MRRLGSAIREPGHAVKREGFPPPNSGGSLTPEQAPAVLGAPATAAASAADQPDGLTAREVEVLRLLARGSSTREIADQLAIAPKTAGNHVEHIYAKIGATNRASASLFAMQHGLLEA